MIADITSALGLMLTWEGILWICIGYSFGGVLGAIPGLTGIVGIALLLPITYYLPPWVAIAMLLAIAKGSSFGAAIPAVLLNTPGTPSAAAVCIDGYPMARKGQAEKALKVILYAGLIGDIFSDLVLIMMAGVLASIALTFGPAEYASMIVFALTVVGAVAAGSMVKGAIGAALGMLLAVVGMDMISGVYRLTFGVIELGEGIGLIPMLIGFLAMSEIFLQVEDVLVNRGLNHPQVELRSLSKKSEDRKLSAQDWRRIARPIAIGSFIGTIIGALPGLGQSIAGFVSYGEARRFSRFPECFGKGSIEGVAAPEAGAAAVNGSNMIPLLALGIPGDVMAAILLGALMIQGLAPGPLLFEEHRVSIFAVYAGLMLANLVHWPIGLAFIHAAKHLTRISLRHMLPLVIVVSVAGVYALNNSMFDILVLVICGIVGALLRKGGVAPVTIVIGFILGPLLENSGRQALLLSQGNFMTFLERPISVFFLILTALSIATSFIRMRRARRGD